MSKELAELSSGHERIGQVWCLPNRLKSARSLSIEGANYTSHALMRHDVVSEKAVDIGISLQEVLGTRDAALFLKNNVIGLDVALRVLLYPDLRRSI